jgi:hypothetical protein
VCNREVVEDDDLVYDAFDTLAVLVGGQSQTSLHFMNHATQPAGWGRWVNWHVAPSSLQHCQACDHKPFGLFKQYWDSDPDTNSETV